MRHAWVGLHWKRPWCFTTTEAMHRALLGIVGPGLMGLGMAQVAAAHGFDVCMLTP